MAAEMPELTNSLKVLLIDDNPDQAALIQRQLAKVGGSLWLESVDSLARGLERLSEDGFDAVLLDLGLADGDPLDGLKQILAQSLQVPITVLTSPDDLKLAIRAVECGAQDYLLKSEMTGDSLLRSLRHITERKRHQRELERSSQEFQAFTHMVSHELKTPLSVISYSFELLKRNGGASLDAETQEFIDLGAGAARQMGQLIDDLLKYARVDNRGKPLSTVDSQMIFVQARASLHAAIAECNATVTSDPLPAVRADASQLLLLLQHLFGNALKYRGSAAPRVHLSVQRRGDQFLFAVADNGIGIESQFLERIFNLFERLHSDDEYPGTGIGLALCKRIIERHGGRIWAESTLGAGSTFYFSLRSAEEPAPTAGQATS